jgi:hypothetical protein
MTEATRKVYVVVQSDWSYNDEFYTGGDEPLKAFTDREQAEAYLARCQHRTQLDWEELMAGQNDRRFTVVEMDVGVAP